MTFFWAWVAGVLTLINPCVLPLLPVIIAGSFQSNRHGPLYMAAGLVVSFTVVGVLITAFGHLIGLSEEAINRGAAIIMILFGLVLLVPRAQTFLANLVSPLASGANNRMDKVQQQGGLGQFFIGLLLGAVWSPCVGPTLGGAIGLAASGESLWQAALTMVFFGLGVSTILLLLSYGSRELIARRRERLMRWMPWAKPIMGVALVLVGMTILFHWNRYIDAWLIEVLPVWLQDLSVKF